ncbi:hypothetical protein OPV22_008156 [Ensete ventricosum]|uniref:Uncharacterized protein n=1 Tax=Ensete ventricosum TaxID=4639 RepID=A0AAV8PP31_ENSVE|nr:hypothetical protein OPV22_008156 [Ensete ventricosum]
MPADHVGGDDSARDSINEWLCSSRSGFFAGGFWTANSDGRGRPVRPQQTADSRLAKRSQHRWTQTVTGESSIDRRHI